MLEEYRKHVEDRARVGLPPLALDAGQTEELVSLLKKPPAGEADFLVELLTAQCSSEVLLYLVWSGNPNYRISLPFLANSEYEPSACSVGECGNRLP